MPALGDDETDDEYDVDVEQQLPMKRYSNIAILQLFEIEILNQVENISSVDISVNRKYQ